MMADQEGNRKDLILETMTGAQVKGHLATEPGTTEVLMTDLPTTGLVVTGLPTTEVLMVNDLSMAHQAADNRTIGALVHQQVLPSGLNLQGRQGKQGLKEVIRV